MGFYLSVLKEIFERGLDLYYVFLLYGLVLRILFYIIVIGEECLVKVWGWKWVEEIRGGVLLFFTSIRK